MPEYREPDLRPLGGERRSLFFTLSGPAGTGKTTLIRRWLAKDSSLSYVRNYTTRKPRPADSTSGVKDEEWYHFVTPREFRHLINQGFFVQWANAARGYCSGTPIEPLREAIAARRDLVFDYTPQLYINLRRAFPRHVVGIFIVPTTREEIVRRLVKRGSDRDGTFELKYNMALQDLEFMNEHPYLVVNDDLDGALRTLEAIKLAEQCRVANLDGLEARYRDRSPRSMLVYYDPFGERVARVEDE